MLDEAELLDKNLLAGGTSQKKIDKVLFYEFLKSTFHGPRSTGSYNFNRKLGYMFEVKKLNLKLTEDSVTQKSRQERTSPTSPPLDDTQEEFTITHRVSSTLLHSINTHVLALHFPADTGSDHHSSDPPSVRSRL